MVELEVDYNQRVGEWSLIQESGSALKPMYGPGYTGINNLGNSCYMNSVMQVLFTIKDFQDKYVITEYYTWLGGRGGGEIAMANKSEYFEKTIAPQSILCY